VVSLQRSDCFPGGGIFFGQLQVSVGGTDTAQKIVENFGAGSRDFFARMGFGLHPGKEKDERDPAARVVFDLGSNLIEGGHQADGQGHHFCLEGGRIDAVFRW